MGQDEKKLPVLWCLVIHDDDEVHDADAFTTREAAEKWKEGNQKWNPESVDSWQRVEPYIPASRVRELITALQDRSDRAYCDYIQGLRKDDCLGCDHKLSKGTFGRKELEAHCSAQEKFGQHKATARILAELRDLLAETEG